jgi:hypothetical protein
MVLFIKNDIKSTSEEVITFPSTISFINEFNRNEKNIPLKPPSFFMPNQASFAWKANSADSNDKKQYYPIKS